MGWIAPSTDVGASGWAAARTPRVGIPKEAAVYPRSPPSTCQPESSQGSERRDSAAPPLPWGLDGLH